MLNKLTNNKQGERMNTKKELGSKYYNLLSDITSYTNDRSTFEFELESVLRTYVPAKVLKVYTSSKSLASPHRTRNLYLLLIPASFNLMLQLH